MGKLAGKFRKIILLGLTLCLTVLLCSPALAAQEPVFRLDMDNLNLQRGVSSTLVVSMQNAQGAETVTIEGLENFDVLSQSQSTSTNIVNGSTTYQTDLHITIMPKTTGQFTLKANIRYNGQAYETNALEVTVRESSATDDGAAQDIFVTTILSKADPYLGEKVIISYELYSLYYIENFGFTDNTTINGMIAKDIPADQLNAEYIYLDGVRYAKYEIKQLMLDPIKSGPQTIPSFNLQVNIITEESSGGIFGGFLNSSRPVYLQTEAKELLVKPLPAEGRPKDFSGIVGELQLHGNYSREQVNYGDSLSLQIIASGNCNLDGLKKAINGEVPGFAVYETTKNTTESVIDNAYYVQREFEAILVPEKNGVIDIAPISISYFNPASKKYERAQIPGATIEVLGDMPQLSSGRGSLAAAIETVKIAQVNYTSENDDYIMLQVKKQVLYGILLGLIVLLIIAAIVLWLVLKRKKQDQALKSLYKQLMFSKDTNEVYSLFCSMIKHCYEVSLKASSQRAVISNLPDAALAAQVVEIMDYMESQEQKDCQHLKDKTSSVYRMFLRFS
jgi:hypothetical protein